MLQHKWKILLGVVLVIVGYYGYGVLKLSGVTRSYESTLVDQCRRIDIAPGTEDVQYDPDSGLVYISAFERRAAGEDGAEFRTAKSNGIYALDVSPAALDDIGAPIKVSPAEPSDFQPHGLFLWGDGRGTKRLFVVNHATNGDEIVEIFDIGDDGFLSHAESVSFPEMRSPNDVLAVGPRQFYATNDLKNDSGAMLYAEVLLSLPYGSAVYFDGEVGRTVAKGLAFGNGINISPDGSEVYIAEWTDQQLSIFARSENGDLKKRKSISLPTGVDNLDVDSDGNVWVGGQPHIFKFIEHVEDPSVHVPSVGIKVDPKTGFHERVFVSTDGEINASSVAAVAGDKLVIGAVFDGHVLVCPKPE